MPIAPSRTGYGPGRKVIDTFTRANGALGKTETNQDWIGSQWTVESNKARRTSGANGQWSGHEVTVDCGSANATVEAILGGSIVLNQALIARDTGGGGHYMANFTTTAGYLNRATASNSYTTVASVATPIALGDRIALSAQGNIFTLSVNGIQVLSYTQEGLYATDGFARFGLGGLYVAPGYCVWDDVAITPAPPVPPREVITRNEAMSDSFNRADGVLGSLDSGQLWTPLTSNPFTIVSNKAKKTGNNQYDYTAAGSRLSTDFDVQAVVSGTGFGGLFARAQDGANLYCLQVNIGGTSFTGIYLRSVGTMNPIGLTAVIVVAGDTIRFIGRGGSLYGYVNGALKFSALGTFFTSGSCGLYAYSSGFQLDNFLARSAAAPAR